MCWRSRRSFRCSARWRRSSAGLPGCRLKRGAEGRKTGTEDGYGGGPSTGRCISEALAAGYSAEVPFDEGPARQERQKAGQAPVLRMGGKKDENKKDENKKDRNGD